jgi:alkaline phosphatase D
MQGPMVGAVSDHGVQIWARASGEYTISVEWGTTFDLATAQVSEPVTAREADDFTVVVRVKDLEPNTTYFYRILVDGELDRYLEKYPPFRMKTAPKPGASHDFRIAFGSCPRFQEDRVQPIWSTVYAFDPDLFLWIGDNVYSDSLSPGIVREEYRRQRDVAGLQPVLHDISNLAIWDDHDYGMNNQDKGNPLKELNLEAFKDYWANPSYGLPDIPGVFFRYSYGQVDFFFLDDRYYRDPDQDPDGPDKSMLGAAQTAWFESELKSSTAVFKVLVSGGGWTQAKGETGDSWAAFVTERNKIFDFVRDNEISGVILLSGDSHVGELNVIPWSENGGYDFYDLVSSPLAQDTPDSWLERRPRRIRPVYFQSSNFGLIDFLFESTPRLVYRVIDLQGRSVWKSFEVRVDELVNGVQSWPSKVGEEPAWRHKNYDEGKGYYEIPVPD